RDGPFLCRSSLGFCFDGVDLLGQSGFFAGGGVFVDEPFARGLVELLDRRQKRGFGGCGIAAGHGGFHGFDGRAACGPLRAVVLASPLVLSGTFDGRSDVRHVSHLPWYPTKNAVRVPLTT